MKDLIAQVQLHATVLTDLLKTGIKATSKDIQKLSAAYSNEYNKAKQKRDNQSLFLLLYIMTFIIVNGILTTVDYTTNANSQYI